jgi:small subunit ribosomal protein S18e
MPSTIVGDEFQHILRVMNTNIEGRERVQIAITAIRGVGRRFASLILKKAEIDPTKRAGTLSQEEIDKIVAIITDPLKFKIPAWFLNRQRDTVTGKTYQLHAQQVAGTLREDLERLKKMRCHRGLRHYWGIRVRGHRTKTSGRTRGRHVAGK